MNLLLPLISSILQAGAFTLDKVTLSLRNITYRTYIGVGFPIYWAVVLVIFLVVQPPLFPTMDETMWLLLLAAIAFNFGNNIIYYRALDRDRLGELQTIDLFRTIPIILVTSFLFADERNPIIVIAALVASLAIIWSHWQNHHFAIRKNTLQFLAWGLVSAPLGASVAKILLRTWNPVSLWLVEDAVISVLAIALYHNEFKKTSRRLLLYLTLISILSATGWILYGYSYQQLGVVYTTLVFSLHPMLVYLASIFFLKEKPHWKKSAAFAIVLASIAAAQIFG